jgi:hypothetical protein
VVYVLYGVKWGPLFGQCSGRVLTEVLQANYYLVVGNPPLNPGMIPLSPEKSQRFGGLLPLFFVYFYNFSYITWLLTDSTWWRWWLVRVRVTCLELVVFMTLYWQIYKVKGLMTGCHSFCLFFIFYKIHTFIQSHSYNTFIHRHLLRPLSISSSLVCSVGNTSLWCRAENRARA